MNVSIVSADAAKSNPSMSPRKNEASNDEPMSESMSGPMVITTEPSPGWSSNSKKSRCTRVCSHRSEPVPSRPYQWVTSRPYRRSTLISQAPTSAPQGGSRVSPATWFLTSTSTSSSTGVTSALTVSSYLHRLPTARPKNSSSSG